MTLRPHLVFAAFGSDLESPSEPEDKDLEVCLTQKRIGTKRWRSIST